MQNGWQGTHNPLVPGSNPGGPTNPSPCRASSRAKPVLCKNSSQFPYADAAISSFDPACSASNRAWEKKRSRCISALLNWDNPAQIRVLLRRHAPPFVGVATGWGETVRLEKRVNES